MRLIYHVGGVVSMDELIAYKLASDIAEIEGVISCYVVRTDEVLGEEAQRDLREMATVLPAFVRQLHSDAQSARLKFSEFKAVVLLQEEADIVVFFEADRQESRMLSRIREIVAETML